MKNLIIALSLLFAVGATAQVKKAAPKAKPVAAKAVVAPVQLSDEAKVQKNISDLNAAVPLTDEQKVMMKGLFSRKYEMYHNENGGQALSPEQKATVARVIERKLEATFDGNTFTSIKNNKVLFSSLVND